MAFRISFFKSPQHRVFHYSPLFWNPEKEEFDKRVARSREEVKAAQETQERRYVPGSNIRGSFKKNMEVQRRAPKNQNVVRWVVLISLIVIMIAAVYFTQGISYLMSLIK